MFYKAMIMFLVAVMIMSISCSKKDTAAEPLPQGDTSTNGHTIFQLEETMNNMELVEHNKAFLSRELHLKDEEAERAASGLVEVGCGKLTGISDLDDSDHAYAMTLINDKGESFKVTMSYDGYLGVVQDSNGKYLFMPID